MNTRDVRRTLGTLVRLGAVTLTEDSAELTAVGRQGTRRMRAELPHSAPPLAWDDADVEFGALSALRVMDNPR